jgi:hypothetical protein
VQAVQVGDGTPTGSVTFFVCTPAQVQANGGTCSSGGSQVGNAVTTTAVANSSPPASSADSAAITANLTGTWCFRAVYAPGGANGSNYTGSSDARTTECFLVNDTTASSSHQDWLPNDTASVSSTNGAPLTGTLSAQLYTDANCGNNGASTADAVANQLYTKALTGTSNSATLVTNNTTYKVTAAAGNTTVSWWVTFTSTDTNVAPSSHCETTSLSIND